MRRIGLVACAASKGTLPAAAEELYVSELFQKAREFVRRNCDQWFILSAEHHVLRPDTVIAPYNKTLNKMPIGERQAWASTVWQQLQPLLTSGDKITVLAGERYRAGLMPMLEREGYSICLPLRGLRIGAQLQWLKNNLHR